MSAPETDVSDVPEESSEEQKPKLSLEVKVDKRGACQRHVTVTIPREDIDRYMKDAFDELKPKAEVPGFRAGRAPRKLVETRFKDQISEQVKGSLLMDSMTQVNEECEFSAISEPQFDYEAVTLPDEGSLTFEFDLEVRPEFDLPTWKGLQLEWPVRDYSESDVDQHLNGLLARYGRREPHDGPADADSIVVVDMTFRHDGNIISEVEERSLELRPVLSFPDARLGEFDKLMIGAKTGDTRTAKVTISEHADNEELRGKEVEVQIDVLEVRRLELPKLNRAFLDRIGGFEDEADLKKEVRNELERQLKYYQQRHVREQISATLTESATWELPPDLLRRQFRRELEREVMELRASGFGDSEIRAHENRIRQNSLATTETALKQHFILERIAEDEKIDVEPDDYDEEIKLIAAQSDESPRRIRARLEKKGQMDTLRNQIIERKVIDLICKHANFRNVPLPPRQNDTFAIEHFVSGGRVEEEIPEAKHAEEAQELPTPADRS